MGKFNRELAKETEQQSMQFDDASDNQGIELKSPGKMHWIRARGETFEDVLKSRVKVVTVLDSELKILFEKMLNDLL